MTTVSPNCKLRTSASDDNSKRCRAHGLNPIKTEFHPIINFNKSTPGYPGVVDSLNVFNLLPGFYMNA